MFGLFGGGGGGMRGAPPWAPAMQGGLMAGQALAPGGLARPGGLPPYNGWDPAIREAYRRAGVAPPSGGAVW
jgi:hypothetical protein